MNRKEHPLYSTWKTMRTRCNNPNAVNYRNYGGRGIKVCERWNEFWNFIADMGEKPSGGYTLDRIDNNKGYDPPNCRWATRSMQTQNQRHPSKSGVKGVYWYPKIKKWIARTDKDHGKQHLGVYATKQQAAQAVANEGRV